MRRHGRAHLRGYEELLEKGETRFRIVAAVDEVPARAEEFATRINGFAGWDVNTYASVTELLTGEDALDGADICSPHGLHHVLACELLEGGVNVLVEKPIGVTVRASKKIAQTAQRCGRVAATAEQCRRALGQRTIHLGLQRRPIGCAEDVVGRAGGVERSGPSAQLALANRSQIRRLRHGHG